MSEARRFPTDEITGLPHVLLTANNARHVHDEGTTNHHHIHYPRRDPSLEGRMEVAHAGRLSLDLDAISLDKLGGLAVRVSRTQRTPPAIHQLVHKRFTEGPELPRTAKEKFVTVVKNCAGVVPRLLVDPTAREGRELVWVKQSVFDMMVHPWNLHTEQYSYGRPDEYQKQVLGSFFMRYATEQDLSHIHSRNFDELLHTPDPSRQASLGRYILKQAMEVSIAPVLPEYSDWRRQSLVVGSGDIQSAVWKHTPQEAIRSAISRLKFRLAS